MLCLVPPRGGGRNVLFLHEEEEGHIAFRRRCAGDSTSQFAGESVVVGRVSLRGKFSVLRELVEDGVQGSSLSLSTYR